LGQLAKKIAPGKKADRVPSMGRREQSSPGSIWDNMSKKKKKKPGAIRKSSLGAIRKTEPRRDSQNPSPGSISAMHRNFLEVNGFYF
jgi:hypothetical protein